MQPNTKQEFIKNISLKHSCKNKKNLVFVKFNSRYTDYFPEYLKYFGGALRLMNSMYGMTKSGKLFADALTEWLLEAGFIQSQCQMYIYYKYAPD